MENALDVSQDDCGPVWTKLGVRVHLDDLEEE